VTRFDGVQTSGLRLVCVFEGWLHVLLLEQPTQYGRGTGWDVP
jgi:hypothetical protein